VELVPFQKNKLLFAEDVTLLKEFKTKKYICITQLTERCC